MATSVGALEAAIRAVLLDPVVALRRESEGRRRRV